MHLLIHGRVQGVYFRSDACDRARALKLTGWVRNMPDGESIEVVAEGSADKLAVFRKWCAEGPAGAHVRQVEEIQEAESGEFDSFRIRG